MIESQAQTIDSMIFVLCVAGYLLFAFSPQ